MNDAFQNPWLGYTRKEEHSPRETASRHTIALHITSDIKENKLFFLFFSLRTALTGSIDTGRL